MRVAVAQPRTPSCVYSDITQRPRNALSGWNSGRLNDNFSSTFPHAATKTYCAARWPRPAGHHAGLLTRGKAPSGGAGQLGPVTGARDTAGIVTARRLSDRGHRARIP